MKDKIANAILSFYSPPTPKTPAPQPIQRPQKNTRVLTNLLKSIFIVKTPEVCAIIKPSNKGRCIMSIPLERVNSEYKKAVYEGIKLNCEKYFKGSIVSISKTDTASDMKTCKVFISIFVLGDDEKQKATTKKQIFDSIVGHASKIRDYAAKKVNKKSTPMFIFKLDETLDNASAIESAIKKINE
jgi:ribosome-binding factor A